MSVSDRVLSGYCCERCDTFWESELEASDCCPTEVFDAYQCTECGEVWDNWTEARYCCPDAPEENDCAA